MLGGCEGCELPQRERQNPRIPDGPKEVDCLLVEGVTSPYEANTQIKLHGSYPLPGDFMVSGILQNLPGTPIGANYTATNAQIAPSLGRNLAACGTRVP